MNDDDTIQDLKQFIAVTVTQATSHLATKEDIIDTKIDNRADEIMAAIGETMVQTNEEVDSQLDDHSKRLTKLEQHLAS